MERQAARRGCVVTKNARAAPFFHGKWVHNLLLRGPRKFARETVRIADDEDARASAESGTAFEKRERGSISHEGSKNAKNSRRYCEMSRHFFSRNLHFEILETVMCCLIYILEGKYREDNFIKVLKVGRNVMYTCIYVHSMKFYKNIIVCYSLLFYIICTRIFRLNCLKCKSEDIGESSEVGKR